METDSREEVVQGRQAVQASMMPEAALRVSIFLILTLRDPPRPGPAHPREHGDSAAPKSLDPKQ